MLKFFGYIKCDTCRKAMKWLDDHNYSYTYIDVTVNPPPEATWRALIEAGEYRLRDLFNTSGKMYRELNLKSKIEQMSETDAIDLLSKRGRLVKRPIVTDGKRFTVGFKPEVFAEVWGMK